MSGSAGAAAVKDGFAEGAGVLEWYREDTLGQRYEGGLVAGRPEGIGTYTFLVGNSGNYTGSNSRRASVTAKAY
jgi:hypothetical protein